MIATYENLTPGALAGLGFDAPEHACHILQDMAGHDVPDAAFDAFLRVVAGTFAGCADPDRAVVNYGRWAGAVGSRTSAYNLLASHPAAAQMLTTVFAASQFFADLLIHNPEYLEVLTNPTIRDRGRDADALWADLQRRVAIAKTPNARRDALRRFKPPEVLRIGARDLLGYATMPDTAREISDFADVCVRMALQICVEERALAEPLFAIIAMGKLGGQELNYASDIDLIFVHDEPLGQSEANKLGEAVRETLSRATDAGFVFRVDLRLRPEGRFGPISRSLESCRAYYESWAEPWERQALLKARFVAGDAAVGQQFAEMTEAFVYPNRVEESFVESIQNNKRRLEQKVARAGESDVNVKEGVGGIRDIEFAVQLIQLIAGGAHPDLRTGNTLEALDRLAAQGLLTLAERDTLAEAYRWLRTVEHRLQILDERPVRCLPRAPGELDKFGRRLGYPDGPSFQRDYQQHTAQVNTLFQRLFYGEQAQTVENGTPGEIAEWVQSPDDPIASRHLRVVLAALGFGDLDDALYRLRRAVAGSEYGGITPEDRAAFGRLLGPLLRATAETDDPDSALRGMDLLADAAPSRSALYVTLAESARLLPRLCRLAADSPFLWQTLVRHSEYLDLLADDEAMDAPPRWESPPMTTDALAEALIRERLRLGTRDLWGLDAVSETMGGLTRMAEYALGASLAIAARERGFVGGFALIGLGKLGGAELGYGSDLDVLCVAVPDELREAARLAQRVQSILQEETARAGFRYEVDARLRPDGRKGNLALDIETYRAYYAASAQTWERQALLKAGLVAGDPALGQEFRTLAETVVYGSSLTEAQIEEVRAMKRRIETERWKEPNDVKLGPGGLTDIEWTTQLLQWRHGVKRPRVRAPNTLTALRTLRDDALITQADWEALSEAYMLLTQLRNRLYLKAGVASDVPPFLSDDVQARMQSVRAICLRLFYGEMATGR